MGNFHYRTWLVYSNDGLPQNALGLREQARWMHTHVVPLLSIHCHIALHDRKIASMMFSWLVHFDVIATLDHCTSRYTAGSIHIESYLCSSIEL